MVGILRLAGVVVLAAGLGFAASTTAEEPAGTPGQAFWAYLNGDYETAAQYAPAWAEAGDASAQAVLGAMYYSGQGVPFMPVTGLNWLYRAAEQDNLAAYIFLAGIFEAGGLFAPEHERALTWYILATRDEAPALFPSDTMKERKRLEKTLSREEVARAAETATQWLVDHPPPRRR